MPLSIPTREEIDRLRDACREVNASAFATVEDVVSFVMQALKMWKLNRALSKYEWALLAHLARAHYLVVYGVLRLCEAGAGDLAMMQLRAVYETMLSAYWMSIEPKGRAEEFDRFAKLEKVNFSRLFVELEAVKEEELAARHRDPAYARELFAAFPNWIRGWTGKKLGKLEAAVAAIWPREGLADFQKYAKAAREFGNRHTHLSSDDSIARIAVEDGIPKITFGLTERSELWVGPAMKVASWFYGQLADLVIEHTKVTDLARWRDHYDRVVKAAILAEGYKAAGDGAAPSLLQRRTDGFEREQIEAALARAGGVKTRAAEELGITYRGLLKKMKRLGM